MAMLGDAIMIRARPVLEIADFMLEFLGDLREITHLNVEFDLPFCSTRSDAIESQSGQTHWRTMICRQS
jgi:hypothetical protein